MVSYDLLLFMLKIETTTRGTNSTPFLIFRQDHLRSTSGTICGSGSFAAQFEDHFRPGDHLQSGIICGAVVLTSLALHCYAGLLHVSIGFFCKVPMTTGDKGKLLIFFVFFIYFLPSQQDCVLLCGVNENSAYHIEILYTLY